MTPDEVKQSITTWCSSDDDLEVAGDRVEPSTDFALGIRAGAMGGSPVELEVLQGQGADRVTIRRTTTLAGDAAGAVKELIDSRPGSVSAEIERSGGEVSVTAQTFVYIDGLSKHTFVQGASEIARTSRLLEALPGAHAVAASPAAVATPTPAATYTPAPSATPAYASPSPSTATQPSYAPMPSAQPVAATVAPVSQPMPAPSFTPSPAPVAQPMPAAAQWSPTHSVPPQGLRSWASPDPSGPVVANLAPGLPIQVAEVRGAWARIICSNGWTGWIDGRIIGVAA